MESSKDRLCKCQLSKVNGYNYVQLNNVLVATNFSPGQNNYDK